ncbi:MAG: adenosine kinase [Desulfobacteraceae bacterium]|nr:adenosine kinase [Desulfobacteraceae bacterium]
MLYNEFKQGKSHVVCVGSALVDILIHEKDEFLTKTGIEKGVMVYADWEKIEYLIGLSDSRVSIVPGGSACNTAIGIGRLGAKSRFVGKCGGDNMGQLIHRDLEKQNVEPFLFQSDAATGRSLSLISPDAQRSMLTFLGAAGEMQHSDLKPECFEQAAIVHVEGYLIFNVDLITNVFKMARNAGALISLDLASSNVVEQSRDSLLKLVRQYVDILIANEDEALAYAGMQDQEQCLEFMAQDATFAALKRGSRGSMIRYREKTVYADAAGSAGVVDTTGAGDLWASGFLYGLMNHRSLQECAELGSLCGYEVCLVVGASISDKSWEKIHNHVEVKWQNVK